MDEFDWSNGEFGEGFTTEPYFGSPNGVALSGGSNGLSYGDEGLRLSRGRGGVTSVCVCVGVVGDWTSPLSLSLSGSCGISSKGTAVSIDSLEPRT